MVKTYILAPNWTTAPPPDGPINLGHILDDLTEFVPLNRHGVVDITSEFLNRVDTKSGFQMSRGKLVSSELKVLAKLMGLMGMGASAHYKREVGNVLSCKGLDTMTFDPTPEYIAESMNHPAVKRFMQGCRFRSPVYMITGLKVGRGSSLQRINKLDISTSLNSEITPPGSTVETGGGGTIMRQRMEGEIWEESTDFIVAFRVRKIWYHHTTLKDKAHLKNVVMQDGTTAGARTNVTLNADDDISLEDMDNMFSGMDCAMISDGDGGEEVNWIIPNAPIYISLNS